jgi:hypothetical protein
MKNDLYGLQKQVWRMLRNRKRVVREVIQIQKIHNEEWQTYFTQMYKSDINQPNNNNMMKVNDIKRRNKRKRIRENPEITKKIESHQVSTV